MSLFFGVSLSLSIITVSSAWQPFVAALDGMNLALAYYDAEDRLVYWNDQLQKYRSFLELYPGVRFVDAIRAAAPARVKL